MDGVVNIYKPAGPTSFGVVQSVKRILRVKKAGHIGTLDPMAEGVLPIGLNQTTRIIQFLTHLPKEYTARMALGAVTDTQDASGKILETADPGGIEEGQVREVLAGFVGELNQLPPMYSAKKKNGIPLYKLARNGITIERKPVPIRIYSIDFIKKTGNQVAFRTRCSAGTYIRTLCHDIGKKLGCGAHMVQLTRNRVGNFDLQTSLTLEALKTAKDGETLSGKICRMEDVLGFMPEVRVKRDQIKSITQGMPLPKSCVESFPDGLERGTSFRVCDGKNDLVAIVESLIGQSEFDRMSPNEIAFKLKRVLV
ncbi:MAG: tRNA pseudouridine(55) synthase TruB [Nitrospinae bacterium]|nr:tRNA pseudouridine(55) synthase TruB [Nitrospinota bacterium]